MRPSDSSALGNLSRVVGKMGAINPLSRGPSAFLYFEVGLRALKLNFERLPSDLDETPQLFLDESRPDQIGGKGPSKSNRVLVVRPFASVRKN